MENNKSRTSFVQFQSYCKKLTTALNDISGWISKYQVSNNPFLKQHDGQYLSIEVHLQHYLIKINILYSLSYEIPIFMFMVYDLDSMQPIQATKLYTQFMKGQQQLAPEEENTGIHICRNSINNQYFYGLHNCQLSMPIRYLVPYYFSLIGLNPVLEIN